MWWNSYLVPPVRIFHNRSCNVFTALNTFLHLLPLVHHHDHTFVLQGFQPQQNQVAKAPALNSSNNAAPAKTAPMSAAEQQREMQQRAARAGPAATAANVATPDRDRSPAAFDRPAAATEGVVPGPALQLNNHRELLQKSKGANHRVSIHNVAYTVTEDDIIKAVNSKGKSCAGHHGPVLGWSWPNVWMQQPLVGGGFFRSLVLIGIMRRSREHLVGVSGIINEDAVDMEVVWRLFCSSLCTL